MAGNAAAVLMLVFVLVFVLVLLLVVVLLLVLLEPAAAVLLAVLLGERITAALVLGSVLLLRYGRCPTAGPR